MSPARRALIRYGLYGVADIATNLDQRLGLPWRSVERFTLADGSERILDVYLAKVDWDGKMRTILVDEADATRWSE